MNNRKFAHMPPPNRDLISGLYRKIGISAVSGFHPCDEPLPGRALPPFR
jgi:hypothetical protein